jgi:hypothetical protein
MNNVLSFVNETSRSILVERSHGCAFADGRSVYYDLTESEVFWIAEYFTAVWMHTFEHVSNIERGEWPQDIYNGLKIWLSIGRYEIILEYVAVLIPDDEGNDIPALEYDAIIRDTSNAEVIVLNIENSNGSLSGYTSSHDGETGERFVRYIVGRMCHSSLRMN